MATFNVSDFTVSRKGNEVMMVAEASSLGGNPFHQLRYPDPGKSRGGITVVGRNSVDFYIAREIRDRENELIAYELKPTRESLRRVPESGNVTVHILND